MRRKSTSLVRQIKDSPYFFENFTVNGRRFRGSLGTAERPTAEKLAAKHKAEAERDAILGIETAKRGMTLFTALGRYFNEHGQYLPTSDDMMRMSRVLIEGLGKDTPIVNLSAKMLTAYAARRRNGRSNRSVNIELGHLRAVINRARDLWDEPVPKLIWKNIRLEEAGPREHILSDAKEERLFAALRDDFHAMVRFALITGLRLGNVIRLRWTECDGDVITVRVKSKKPGGKLLKLPIIDEARAILDGERGRHPEFVFTFVCQRNRRDYRIAGGVQYKDQRYPFTQSGWRRDWAVALKAAEIDEFRFHDLRHTSATRMLKETGSIELVQKLLGHEDIQTTMRYAHSDIDDVRAAMEAVAKRRPPVRLIVKNDAV
jgi:integrase